MNAEILPQLLVNACIAGSLYALISVGLTLSYGLLRILNFAHGHLLMVGAYLFLLFSDVLGMHPLIASLLTMAGGAAVAWLVLGVAIVPFREYHSLLTLVSSLAVANVLEAAIAMTFGVNVRSLSLGAGYDSIAFGSIFITPIQIGIITGTTVLLSSLGAFLQFTTAGRRIRAVAERPHSAAALGIEASRIRTTVFIGSALLAMLAGVATGLETSLQPTMGSSLTVKAFAAMVFGGLGNVWGTIVGSYVLALIENLAIGLDFGNWSIPAGYKDAFAFAMILGIMLIRPDGLFARRGRTV